VGFNAYSDGNLRIPAASMYVKRHFSVEAKAEMLNMITYIKGAFAKMLEKLEWMDLVTTERAKIKMTTMDQFIAYPDELLMRDKVDGLHSGRDAKG